VGNNCLPEEEENNSINNSRDNSYYCYFLLSNNNKEFNLNFSVSTSIQEDNYAIYYYHNNEKIESKYIKYYLKI